MITITTRTHLTWMSVLGYVHSEFQSTGISHDKWLVGYYDEHKNFHYENPKTPKDMKDENQMSNNKNLTPVYVLDPWKETEHLFEWRGAKMRLKVREIMETKELYKSPDNPLVYEPCTVIELETEKKDTTDDFLREAYDYLLYTMRFKATNEVVLWVWSEDYWRRIPNALTKRSLSTIYLPEKDRTLVCRDIEHFLSPETKEKYRMFGIPYHRTYCFHGLAGTGKTSFIHALASSYNKNIAIMPFDPKLTDSAMIEVVTRIPENSFLVLEDFDSLFDSDHKSCMTLSAFLNCMDGLQSKSEQIVFLTTNNYLQLDPVICRPGRIDVVVEFKEIVRQQLIEMLGKFFPDQSDKYEAFYDMVKDKRLTTCMLQQYLFQRYPDKCILQNLDKNFTDMIVNHRTQTDSKRHSLYA